MQLIKFYQRKNIISQIFSTEINLLFSNSAILKNLLNLLFVSKQKDSKDFKTRLGLLYYETEEIKHTNKDKERDTKDKKICVK